MGQSQIVTAWRQGFTKPDRRSIADFSRTDVNLQGDYDPKGFFRVDTSRYLILPLMLLRNPSVRMLNLLKAIQTGGTLVGDLLFYWVLRNAPGPFMFTLQTDDDAEQHYLTRLEPTLKESKTFAKIYAGLHKKRDLYQFPGMNVFFQGANMNSLQRKSIKYEFNDEVWDWAAGMLAEAWGRTERFSRSCKIVNCSQGGEEGSEWDEAFDAGHLFEWGAFCAKCNHHQPYAFFANMLDAPDVRAGVVWNNTAKRNGRWNIEEAAASARFRCCKCGHEHPNEPRTWDRFNAGGAYLDLQPERSLKNCSCHWESMVNGNYDSLVAEFLRAKQVMDSGSTVALKKFYQKKLARMWSLSDTQEKIVLRTTDNNMVDPWAEGFVVEPEVGEIQRFITADFQEGQAGQGRHFRVVARVWLKGGRSRMIFYGRIDTPERLEALRIALKVKPPAVCVDGGHLLRTVAGWCARYGWTMLIGSPAKTFPHLPKKKGERAPQLAFSRRYRTDPRAGKVGAGKSFAWTFDWSNPSVKPITANLRDGLGVEWLVADDAPEEYRDGLNSEVLTRGISKKTGRSEWFWKQIKDNNHPWDCENMQTVCALIAELLAFDVPENENDADGSDGGDGKGKKTKPLEAPHDQPEQMTLLGGG